LIRARTLLLVDGASDVPLGAHAATLARDHGVALDVVAPPFERMDPPPGHTVAGRLQRILEIDPDFDAILVHRDAEARSPVERDGEIHDALAASRVALPRASIVPVRMTEAWLLLDETAIRRVAGRPSGTADLGLPRLHEIETIADPKKMLGDALLIASGASGRRRRKLERDFGAHRRQLLEDLDPNGPVRSLSAWQALARRVAQMASVLQGGTPPGELEIG
jgi:hypothetical protein